TGGHRTSQSQREVCEGTRQPEQLCSAERRPDQNSEVMFGKILKVIGALLLIVIAVVLVKTFTFKSKQLDVAAVPAPEISPAAIEHLTGVGVSAQYFCGICCRNEADSK